MKEKRNAQTNICGVPGYLEKYLLHKCSSSLYSLEIPEESCPLNLSLRYSAFPMFSNFSHFLLVSLLFNLLLSSVVFILANLIIS